MAERQRGTPAYSLPNAKRRSPNLAGVTVPREVIEAVKARLEPGQTLSAAVREALEMWLARAPR
jgi:hypothetical protein